MKGSIVLVALLLLAGCSPRTYVLSSGRTNVAITEPLSGEESRLLAQLEQSSEQELVTGSGVGVDFSTSDMEFSKEETQHVSITSYNPFDEFDNDIFYLDLTKLKNDFTYPVDGGLVSPFSNKSGKVHEGVDLVAPVEAPIYAVFSGVVRMSGMYGDYGNVVVVRHSNGLETVYAHNSRNLVKVGSEVESGDKIALCGRTGNATTTHLHFEVRVCGKSIDPELLLDVQSRVLQDGELRVEQHLDGEIEARLVKDINTVSQEDLDATAYTSRGIKVGGNVYDAPKPKPEPEVYHTVKSGESLWLIAKKYSTTINELCEMNGISKSKPLYVGKKLRVK